MTIEMNIRIPIISNRSLQKYYKEALNSQRQRACKVLHKKGARFNKVFNFLCLDTYMHPHLHPGLEKEEIIHCLKGELAVIFFNNLGDLETIKILKKNMSIIVPPYKWHTYVVLSKFVVTYETMPGVYDISSWKKLSRWSPKEDSIKAKDYLTRLRTKVLKDNFLNA
jgi:cupin fold WbuC family metalloprotein